LGETGVITIGDPIRTVPPAALPVSLAELKAHLRVDESHEDASIMGYCRAAVEHVERYTGMGLITQTWKQTYSAFPRAEDRREGASFDTPSSRVMRLWRRPVQAVPSIEYLDGAGVTQTLDPSVYEVAGANWSMTQPWIALASGKSWPATYVSPQAITVTYRVGFGDDHNAVPELIRHAILLVVGTWYGYREDVVMGAAVAEIPLASKALLRDWRPLAAV
jgi:uncharacterized phiE125 gp8 family phage protein